MTDLEARIAEIRAAATAHQWYGTLDSRVWDWVAFLLDALEGMQKERDTTLEYLTLKGEVMFKEIRAIRAQVEMLRGLLEKVTLDAMGGIPDLFYPDGGWECWDADVRAALNTLLGGSQT